MKFPLKLQRECVHEKVQLKWKHFVDVVDFDALS